MALLGAGFDDSQPAGSTTPANQIDESVRDIKTRLKGWATVLHDLETGQFKDNIIASAKLMDTGVTPGDYTKFTVNAKGQITAASSPTTLAGFGITDAEGASSMKSTQYGGTGLDASAAANGTLLIGTGAGLALATLTAGDNIDISNASGGITISTNLPTTPWLGKATLPSATAITPVALLADEDVPTGKKPILQGYILTVNGGTLWATTSEVKIQDSDTSPNDFASIGVAGLTANATLFPSSANTTLHSPFTLGNGGVNGKGLQIKGDANGTGSDIVVTAWGVLVDV